VSYPPPAQPWTPPYAPPPTRSGNGVAVAALVVAVIALLGVIAVGVFAVAVLGGGGEPLTGRLPAVSPRAPLSGSALADAVSDRITKDGGDVGRVRCPETAKVAQGTVTVCHATIDDGDWAVVVFFEDAQGTFTLDPI
jgi:uncharacterized protein DUF4333